MTNQHFPRRLLDDAIDRAVQEMMHVDPRPGLRRRVLAKLNAPSARISWIPRFGIAAAALAALVLAIVLMRPGAPAPESSTVTAPPSAISAPRSEDVPKAHPPVARKESKPDRPRTVQFDFGPRSDRVTATNLPPARDAAADIDIGKAAPGVPPPLPALTPIVIAPLAPPAEIVVRPIEVKPIEVAAPPRSR